LTTDLLRAYFKTLWDADNSRGSKLRLEPRHPNTVRVRFLNYLESRQWVEAGEHYELTRSELTRGLPSPTLLLSSASSPHFNANYPNYNPSQKSAAGGSPHYSQPYSQDGTARTSPRAGGRDPSRLSVGGGADARQNSHALRKDKAEGSVVKQGVQRAHETVLVACDSELTRTSGAAAIDS
ncbi:hypothetical protein T492DRAFT_872849, partial [Pavlovales sp. CCMP2436]